MTDLPIWLTGILLIVVLPAVVVVGQAVLRRVWPALREGDHNEVTGFIIAVVGVIYAVLLGFVVIVSWENFNEAENVVGQARRGRLARARAAVKRHSQYNEHEYFLAVEAAFVQWEDKQTGR